MSRRNKGSRKVVVALFGVMLAASVLAGCLHGSDDPEPDPGLSDAQDDDRRDPSGPEDRPSPPDNGDTPPPEPQEPPQEPRSAQVEAVLQVDSEDAWVGENFTFDGHASVVLHGEVVQWRFAFGDNETMERSGEEEPIVAHNYSTGGTYTVNLTVFVQGEDGEIVENTTSLRVSVHERIEIPETEVSAGLLSSDEEEHPFDVRQDAQNFSVHLQLEHSAMFFESSDGTVRVLDPDGEAVAEQEFSASDGELTNITLEGAFNTTGEYFVEVEVDSGGVEYHGSLYVVYRILD